MYMRTVRTTGKSSQRKGRKGEFELAAILREHGYDVQAAEPLNYGTIPDLTGLPHVHIECKRAETTKIWDWFFQAQADAKKFNDGRPAIFFRRSRSPWMVCMELSDWLELYKRHECRCGGHCNERSTENET